MGRPTLWARVSLSPGVAKGSPRAPIVDAARAGDSSGGSRASATALVYPNPGCRLDAAAAMMAR
jgi:hypothetical protein